MAAYVHVAFYQSDWIWCLDDGLQLNGRNPALSDVWVSQWLSCLVLIDTYIRVGTSQSNYNLNSSWNFNFIQFYGSFYIMKKCCQAPDGFVQVLWLDFLILVLSYQTCSCSLAGPTQCCKSWISLFHCGIIRMKTFLLTGSNSFLNCIHLFLFWIEIKFLSLLPVWSLDIADCRWLCCEAELKISSILSLCEVSENSLTTSLKTVWRQVCYSFIISKALPRCIWSCFANHIRLLSSFR